MTTRMQLPLIGKIKYPSGWVVGLMAASVLVIGSTTFLVVNRATPRLDIDSLTVPVQSKNTTLQITASGSVKPIQSVNVSPKTSGRLVQLLVEQGDKVERGQIIARMDNADLQAQLNRTRANVAQAQAKLDEALAGSRSEEIGQARARLAQAEAQLSLARAGSRPEEIAQAKAQVDAAASRVTLTKNRVQRNRNLYKQGAIAQDTLDEVLADDNSARATLQEAQRRLVQLQNGSRSQDISERQAAAAETREALRQLQNGSRPEAIAQAKAVVNAAKGELQSVQVQLEDTVIRAPFSGTITQKYATVGAFVTPTTSASSTQSATSASIVALARGLEIVANIPEVDIGQIKQGQSVEIVADAYPDQTFKGRVRLISPEAVVDQNVTSFQVRVDIDTGKNQLRSGMNVDVTFLGETLKDAQLVPTVAIVTEKGKTGVLVPDQNNKPQFRPVTIGPSVEDQTQVLSGIKAGERVFIDLPKDQQPKQDQ